MTELHEVVNRVDFERLYNLEDPRPYYRSLRPLAYRIPEPACAVLQSLHGALGEAFGTSRPRVLDFACGYGVNGALLDHDVTLTELFEHYCGPASEALGWPAFRERDRGFFAEHRRPEPAFEICGVDVAENAVAYSLDAGLLDEGFVVDLTRGSDEPWLPDTLAELDLILETGAHGEHLTAALDRILAASGPSKRPWILMCSRPDFDYGPLHRMLHGHDYVVEQITSRPHRFRRLIGPREKADIFKNVRALGADPADHFEDEHFLVHLLLARARRDVERWPLARLLQAIPEAVRSGGG